MKNKMKFFYLASVFLGIMSQQTRYHGEFYLKFLGKLPNKEYQTIFSAEGQTFGKTINKCSQFCANDQRCIGIEICQIRMDLFECRVCCGWMKIGTNSISDHPGCKYLEMKTGNDQNLAVSAALSSIFDDYNLNLQAVHAVDGLTLCPEEALAHTKDEINLMNPWLRIGLNHSVNVMKVLIHNRYNCCGERLKDVMVNVTGSGRNHPCGFYPGPAENGDRILIWCKSGTWGNDVTIYILPNGQLNSIAVCEVEVYGRP